MSLISCMQYKNTGIPCLKFSTILFHWDPYLTRDYLDRDLLQQVKLACHGSTSFIFEAGGWEQQIRRKRTSSQRKTGSVGTLSRKGLRPRHTHLSLEKSPAGSQEEILVLLRTVVAMLFICS